MKNRILSLLLVIAMLLPVFNITAMAASEPTITSHKNGKSYAPDDFYIKWKSVDGANRYRLAVKSLNDGSYAADIWWDDNLTKTKYECDEDDIKPGHRYKIWVAACGSGHDDVLSQYSIEVIAEDECEHDDYDEEVDDIEYDQISGDDTYHYVTEYYKRVCKCGETIKKNIEGDTEKEKHNFSGDKCKNCGYTKKAQPTKPSISSASVSPTSGVVNDTKFYFTVKTNKDTTDLLVVSQDGWDITSDYLKDLKSSTNGDTKTWTFWLQINNVNSSYVNIYALNDAGDESSAKKVSFSLTTGVCPHTDYDEHLDSTDYESISGDDTYHYVTEYYKRVCVCGETLKKNIEGNSTKEKHNFSGDKCKNCGYTKKAQSTKPSINSASVTPTSGVVNDTKFKFTVKTNVDTTDILVKSFDGWDITSDYLQDLKCSTSGSTKTWTFWLQMNNVNSSYVNVYALNDNGDMSSAKKISFSLNKGVCKHANYDEYLEDTDYEPISGDDTYHYATEYYKRVCECGETIKNNIKGNSKKEKHNFSGDKCKNCGYTKKTQAKPSISSASVSPTSGTLNDTKFKFTVKTNKDTTDLLVRAFNGYEITSSYLNDLKCSTSGSTKTWTFWLKINNIDSKYINIYALNDNGDESSAKKVSFTVKEAVVKDTTKPQVTKLECENGETFTQTSGYVTFNVNATDNIGVSKIELYLGNTKLGTENGSSVGFAILGNKFKVGKNTISAYAYDDAGNKSSAKTITLNIKEQQTISKPSINSASVSPTKGTLNETQFKFTVKTNKDTTDLLVRAFNGYEITSNNLKDLKCSTSGNTKTWTFWLQINNINSQYINVYALNDDGEESSAKKVSFTVSEKKDTTKPQVTKLECENGTTFSQTNGYVTFNVKATDNIGVSKIELYCGNKKLAENNRDSMGAAVLCSEFAVGQNTVTAYAYDKAGNKSSAKTIKITIKAVEGKGTPTISSANVSPTKGTLNETQFKFTVKTNKEATDLLVRAFNGYEITSDKLNDLKCTTSGNTKTWTFWLKINNINSSYVNVYALNDNDDESGAKKVSFTVSEPPKKDETSPVIGDITSSAGSTFKKGTSTKITVTVTDENLSEAVLYVDNKKIKNFTSGKISSTLPSLAIGAHNVTIKAKDKAGNAAEKSIMLTVTDPKTVIPMVEVLSATNITATSATLQGKVTSNSGVKIKKYGFAYDDGTNTQYKWIDGHIDNNKVFTANITGLKPETTYSYQVIAVNENDIEGKSNNYMKFTTLEGVAEPEKGKEEQTFTDVSKDEYYSDDVEELNNKGIITGYGNGEFKPNNTLTRAEAAVILCRLNGDFNVSPSKTKFPDVNSNCEWASGYIAKAVQLGIISGMPDGTYNPEGTLTAEQFITMIVRWMGLDNNAANRAGEHWSSGYKAVAEEIGLIDDVNIRDYSKNISRADASVIANAARGLKGTVTVEKLNKKPSNIISEIPLVNSNTKGANNISEAGKKFIKQQEGLVLNMYDDDKDYSDGWQRPTIGYGTLVTDEIMRAIGASSYSTSVKITQKQADEFFEMGITSRVNSLNKILSQQGISLTQNQYDAIMSWLYNFSISKWNSSNHRLKRCVYEGITDEVTVKEAFTTWCLMDDAPNKALVERRLREANIYLFNNYNTKGTENGENTYYFGIKQYEINNPNISEKEYNPSLFFGANRDIAYPQTGNISQNISSNTDSYNKKTAYKTPITTYTIYNENVSVYSSASETSKIVGTIKGNNECIIEEIYDNGWSKISSGSIKGYVPAYEFIWEAKAIPYEKTIKKSGVKVNKRVGEPITGWSVDKNETVWVVSDNEDNGNAIQIIYRIGNSSKYKMGWVDISAFTDENPITVNNNFGAPSSVSYTKTLNNGVFGEIYQVCSSLHFTLTWLNSAHTSAKITTGNAANPDWTIIIDMSKNKNGDTIRWTSSNGKCSGWAYLDNGKILIDIEDLEPVIKMYYSYEKKNDNTYTIKNPNITVDNLTSTNSKIGKEIFINGVDIGYKIGDYFSTTGKACNCHNQGLCIPATSKCTCIHVDGTAQCYAFALHCQNKLFGENGKSSTDKFTKSKSIKAKGVTAANIKELIDAAPIGSHIRVGFKENDNEHSMVLIEKDENGFTIIQANGGRNKEYTGHEKCRIGTTRYTWQEYADSDYGSRGIQYISMPK